MNTELADDPVSYALKQLARLDRQEARVLELARRPGLSKKDLRHYCQAMFHLLCCRRTVLAKFRDWGVELPADSYRFTANQSPDAPPQSGG